MASIALLSIFENILIDVLNQSQKEIFYLIFNVTNNMDSIITNSILEQICFNINAI